MKNLFYIICSSTVAVSALAATSTWNETAFSGTTATTSQWSEATNWTGDTVPSSTDDIEISVSNDSSTGGAAYTILLPQNETTTVKSLTVKNSNSSSLNTVGVGCLSPYFSILKVGTESGDLFTGGTITLIGKTNLSNTTGYYRIEADTLNVESINTDRSIGWYNRDQNDRTSVNFTTVNIDTGNFVVGNVGSLSIDGTYYKTEIGSINLLNKATVTFNSCGYDSTQTETGGLYVGNIAGASTTNVSFAGTSKIILTGADTDADGNSTSYEIDSAVKCSNGSTYTVEIASGAMQAFTNETNALSNLVIDAGGYLAAANASSATISIASGGTLGVYTSSVDSVLNAVSIEADGGAIISLDLTTDSIELSGALSKSSSWTDGNSVIFDFIDLDESMIGSTFEIMTFDSTDLLISDFTTTSTSAGVFAFSDDGKALNFTVSAVPEPSYVAAIIGLLALGFVFKRGKK